ncbi:MAG TPA: DUF5808 domain-containing protein [Pseudonocardiaceae bacterium]|jgi:hypothetical protein
MAGNKKVALAVVAGLTAAAVITELRKPPEEREWHGKIGNFVPYDLRPPTFAKVRDRVWDVDNPNLIVPHAFGIGWTINLGRLYKLANPAG